MLEATTQTGSRGIGIRALTGREREVLRLVEHGLTNSEIARRMRIARPTVRRLLSNAMDRLGAASRTHAVMLAGPTTGEMPADEGQPHRVELGQPPPATTPVGTPIGADARALIGRIAAGDTLTEAAFALHLSRRTADRRLAQAKAALGVDRTIVAIVCARRFGWLD